MIQGLIIFGFVVIGTGVLFGMARDWIRSEIPEWEKEDGEALRPKMAQAQVDAFVNRYESCPTSVACSLRGGSCELS